MFAPRFTTKYGLCTSHSHCVARPTDSRHPPWWPQESYSKVSVPHPMAKYGQCACWGPAAQMASYSRCMARPPEARAWVVLALHARPRDSWYLPWYS